MKRILFSAIFLFSLQGFAHGEDKPGPHGGFISMPGAFHVELVPVNAQELKAYLLDIHWKNPSVKDSTIAIKYGAVTAACEPAQNHFVCRFPKEVDLKKKGELGVKASRESLTGVEVKYALPLTLKKSH